MEKVVVTGGAGFIGSHLAEKLAGRGYQVTIIDDLSSGKRENIERLLNQDKVEFIEGSILTPPLLQKLFQGTDYVFHQAAIPSVPRSVNNPLASGELAKGSGIFKPKGPAGTEKTTGGERISRTEADNQTVLGTAAQPAGDVYESTSTNTLKTAAELTKLIENTEPEPREDAVNRVRERIQSGYYNAREFFGRLATKLINTGTGS